jgi:hypothetical protein
MKKLIAFPITWTLYGIGDLSARILYSKPFNIATEGIVGWMSERLSDLYTWCMDKSMRVQDWAELSSPWKKPQE